MKKSLYSLLLFDEVVQAIDRLAYEEGTSRSNLINQILAKYASCTTPEMRMKSVFDEFTRLLSSEDVLQVRTQPSDAMISVRSLLPYKYNPTVQYSVELYKGAHPAYGTLRVYTRTKSTPFISSINGFFERFSRIEQSMLAKYAPGYRVTYVVNSGKYTREFVLTGELLQSEELAGQAIAGYIKLVDASLKSYFAHLDDMPSAIAAIMQIYTDYIKNTSHLI